MHLSARRALTAVVAVFIATAAHPLEVIGTNDLAQAFSETSLAPGGSDSGPGPLSNSAEAEETRQGSTAQWQTEGTTIVGNSPTAIAKVTGNITEFGASRRFAATAQAKLTYQIETRQYEVGGGDQYGFELPITLFGTASVNELGYAEGSVDGSSADGDILIIPSAGGGLVYSYATADSIPESARNGSTQNFTGEFWLTPDIPYSIILNAFAQATITSAQGPDAINSASSEAIVDPTFAFDQARYDARRATDPTLPDIQLDDIFFLGISANVLTAIEGDYNGDGFVSQADLDLVLLNWGAAVTPPGFDESALPGGGSFDSLMSQNELDGVLLNWGEGTPPVGSSIAIPEPGTAMLCLGLAGGAIRRRRAL